MKLFTLTLTLTALLGFLVPARAADPHVPNKVVAGPNGGRIVELTNGQAEFLVQPDKKVRITFFDGKMKPIAPAAQDVTVIAEAPAGKTKLVFEKSADALVSATTLPEGEGYRVVLQVRETAEARPQNFRIDYHSKVCSGCHRAEYACTCASEGEGGHGH